MKLGKIVEQHVQLYLADDDSLRSIRLCDNAQKMKFSIKNFFSKCDQIRSFLRIWSHLLKKSLMANFSFLCIVRKNYVSIFYLFFKFINSISPQKTYLLGL